MFKKCKRRCAIGMTNTRNEVKKKCCFNDRICTELRVNQNRFSIRSQFANLLKLIPQPLKRIILSSNLSLSLLPSSPSNSLHLYRFVERKFLRITMWVCLLASACVRVFGVADYFSSVLCVPYFYLYFFHYLKLCKNSCIP